VSAAGWPCCSPSCCWRSPRLATTANFLLLGAVLLVPTAVGIAAGLPATAAGVVWGVVMGAGTTAFAYVAWYACQRSLTGTGAGSAQLLIPVITTLGAVLLLGERLSWTLLVAAALVAAGLWLNRPGQ
jgi:drug/metabolite transporter (DMT)-like permease